MADQFWNYLWSYS